MEISAVPLDGVVVRNNYVMTWKTQNSPWQTVKAQALLVRIILIITHKIWKLTDKGHTSFEILKILRQKHLIKLDLPVWCLCLLWRCWYHDDILIGKVFFIFTNVAHALFISLRKKKGKTLRRQFIYAIYLLKINFRSSCCGSAVN